MKWLLALLLPILLMGECQLFKATGSHVWIPVSYMDQKTEQAYGIAPDLLREISKEINIPLEFHLDIPWKRALLKVQTGHADILTGAYETKERREKYLYSLPFYSDEIRIFVMKERHFQFNGLQDLVGKSGGRPFGGELWSGV